MSSSETEALARFRHLEGYRVAVMLADGSRLDDVELISAGRGEVDSLWLDRGGIDLFVRKVEVVDLHEVAPLAARESTPRAATSVLPRLSGRAA